MPIEGPVRVDRYFVNGSLVGKPHHGVIVARIEPISAEAQWFPGATETLVVHGPIGGTVELVMMPGIVFTLQGPASLPLITDKVEFVFKWKRFGQSLYPMGIIVRRPDGFVEKIWTTGEQNTSVLVLSAYGGQMCPRKPFNISAKVGAKMRPDDEASTSRELANIRVVSQYDDSRCPLRNHTISVQYRPKLEISVKYCLRVRNIIAIASYASFFEGAGSLYSLLGFNPANINALIGEPMDAAYSTMGAWVWHTGQLRWHPADSALSIPVGMRHNYMATLTTHVWIQTTASGFQGGVAFADAQTSGWDFVSTIKMVPVQPFQ